MGKKSNKVKPAQEEDSRTAESEQVLMSAQDAQKDAIEQLVKDAALSPEMMEAYHAGVKRVEAETAEATDDGFKMPCTGHGLSAAASGGVLGFIYGFGSKTLMHKGPGRFKAAKAEGWSSAKAFAVFGGVYALSSCIVQRIRQKEDAITSGTAGAITGLIMGLNGGPMSALSSAAMMGVFSVVIDGMGRSEALAAPSLRHSKGKARRVGEKRNQRSWKEIDPVRLVLCPAAGLLRPQCQGGCSLPFEPLVQWLNSDVRKRLL